ncbi:MAG: hypothetical protein ABW168_04915 [Sedimenticola sp.]
MESDSPTQGKHRVLIDHMKIIYPKVRRIRRKTATKTITLYKGIKFKQICVPQKYSTLLEIKQFLTEHFTVTEASDNKVVCTTQHNLYVINGDKIDKTVTFFKDGTWTLKIGKTDINLNNIHISNKFEFTKESLAGVCTAVKLIRLCEGLTLTKSIIITRFHIIERLQASDCAEKRKVRTITCDRVVTINSTNSICRKCQKMTLNVPTANKENEPSVTDYQTTGTSKRIAETENQKSSISNEDIKNLIPGANDEIIELILNQAKNISRDPRGRRWSQNIISVCLQWYCRSPQSYEAFRESKFLVLPSPSTLILYKHKVKHEIGFDDKVLQWMHSEAVRKGLPEEGWAGGVVIDEMSIQSDIQMSKSGDIVELSGLIDVGDEGNNCHILRTGKNEKSLGTHALQFVFLGITGFRFPFAHFITDGVQAPELYSLFWEAVDKLHMFGFKTLYTCMDGAQCNRTFMKYNVGDSSTTYKTPCPCYAGDVIFMMDFSHVMKKIRNNILKSGIHANCTRLLTILPSMKTIQWQMFVDCFKWDKSNSFQIHKKLTNEHMYVSTQGKMRNHLAEDVLDTDMLHTMIQYQGTLGQNGHILNGVIEILRRTSKMIEIFHDMRPIRHMADHRIKELQEVSDWFLDWTKSVENSNDIHKKHRANKLMSYQCHEDIQSCLIGFIELCQVNLNSSNQIFVTPGLVNSDVVENNFNQQRSTYNGANSNPNALQYRRTLNSIILGQNTVSTKANAGKGRDAAMPYNFSLKSAFSTTNCMNKKMKLSGT